MLVECRLCRVSVCRHDQPLLQQLVLGGGSLPSKLNQASCAQRVLPQCRLCRVGGCCHGQPPSLVALAQEWFAQQTPIETMFQLGALAILDMRAQLQHPQSPPFYPGLCYGASCCPANSNSNSMAGGSACNAGYSGSVSATASSPFYSASCVGAACPSNSAEGSVPSGCSCDTSYSGSHSGSSGYPSVNLFSGGLKVRVEMEVEGRRPKALKRLLKAYLLRPPY